MSPERVALNICLVGRAISQDIELTKALEAKHNVSRLPTVAQLSTPLVLSEIEWMDVLVLDCGEKKELLNDVITNVTEHMPHLSVLLVNGGLTTQEIAAALGSGAAEYLALPSTGDEKRVLAERVEVLGLRARQAKVTGGNGHPQQKTLPF